MNRFLKIISSFFKKKKPVVYNENPIWVDESEGFKEEEIQIPDYGYQEQEEVIVVEPPKPPPVVKRIKIVSGTIVSLYNKPIQKRQYNTTPNPLKYWKRFKRGKREYWKKYYDSQLDFTQPVPDSQRLQ